MVFGKSIDDSVISSILLKDMENLGFVTNSSPSFYLSLSRSELEKSLARGGFKPGQIVHREFLESWRAVGFDDLCEVPYRALPSRKDADPSVKLAKGIELKLPLVSANMESVTGYEMAVAMARMGGLGIIHQFMSLEESVEIVRKIKSLKVEPVVIDDITCAPALDSEGRYLVGAARGIRNYSVADAKILKNAGLDILCLDVAQGHSNGLAKAVFDTKAEMPSLPLIAGNVATAKAAYELFDAGADVVKVGIAQSAACATEPNTGAGLPQPHAVYRCSVIAKSFGKKIIGDGGFNTGGKIVKGLAFGADAIMVGQMLAATDMANLLDERFVRHDVDGSPLSVKYYGSASELSKQKQGRPAYDASEGNTVILPFEGSTLLRLAHIDMWIRSGMSYAGSSSNGSPTNLQRLQEHSRWILK